MSVRRAIRNAISAGAHRLRRIQWLHRLLKWLKRTFFRALGEASLEFCRWIWADCEGFGPPQKTFSVYQDLRTGYPKVNGRIVLHDQGCPVVPEDSLMAIGGYNQHAEQPWPIFWSEHQNARLVTESLAMLAPGKKICIESVYGYHGYHAPRLREDPAYRFFRLPRPVRLEGNWTSIVSRWVPTNSRYTLGVVPNHTHWLLDALPRLALVPEFPSDTRIIVPDRLAAYQKESLALLGLLDRCRFTPEHHVEVERYYFSSPTAMLDCYSPYGIKFLRDTFLPKRNTLFSGPRRFFVRRAGRFRDAANVTEIESFFADRGWVPVEPEKLTFAEEIQLFAEAEAITGIMGSGLTNVIFCKPGCHVIQITPTTEGLWLDGYLDWIQQVVHFNLRHIIVRSPYDLRYSISLEQVKRGLAEAGMEL